MIETQIQVKLDRFDGPLGLLLHLIQKEEMNIKDLDIQEITHQYLDYLKKLSDVNFDIAGEYLFLAASLLYIKSKTVTEEEDEKVQVINPEDLEITSKAQLIEKLEQLARFQKLGAKLMDLPRLNEDIFVKPKINRKAIQNSILSPMDLPELTNVMIDFIRREKRKYTVVKRDRLSIKEKLIELKNSLKVGSRTNMESLINWEKGKTEVVITFISLLELARLKRLEITQEVDEKTHFGSIFVDVKEDLAQFDVDTADGFDPEDENESVSEEDLEVAAPEQAFAQNESSEPAQQEVRG